jgi:hypothetical protein
MLYVCVVSMSNEVKLMIDELCLCVKLVHANITMG